ncbi:hypothetical protein PI95_010720 [Hassallia byssoidea VB512170]|uniref:Uncharacterized protein n=1 Tax=Hassallia byssoidea VB512170 TaxID=1304833 RepID=A0A846H7V0_9CYAN|nr:hypothetical protein [Hassalia byssoidea]NEU73018.1 hypothetical protein [Hassalia byssoidea VB512170]
MSRLKIYDLSFCETANISQVRGGLSEDTADTANIAPKLDILDWLMIHIPGFYKQSSKKTGEYLLEEFSDQNGQHYGYRATSQDGKELLGGASGQINNVNYAVSFASRST